MFAEERQKLICDKIEKNGSVSLGELTSLFSVSTETIRKDLLALEHTGKLRRTHGGAVGLTPARTISALDLRLVENRELKEEIARLAVACIEEKDMIAIDSGSTAIVFAEALCGSFRELTVVTHSLDVFNILKNAPGFKLILTGGDYIHEEKAFYGAFTEAALSNLTVNKAFIFPSAISLEHGINDFEPRLYEVQLKYISISEKVFFLADSTKFEKTAPYKLRSWNSPCTVLTDSRLSETLLGLYLAEEIDIKNK